MADPAFGAKSSTIFDFENGWGVDKTVPAGKKLGVVSNSLVGAQELIDNPTIRGDFNSVDPFNGRKSAAGDIVLVPTLEFLPFLQKWLTGTLVETGTTPNFILTSKLGTAMPPSATIETSFDVNSSVRYSRASGVRIARVGIPFAVDGPLQITVGTMAKDVTIGSAAYDASPTDFSDSTYFENLLLAAADVKIGGSAVAYVQSGQLDIDAALFGDDYRVGGGGARGSLVPGRYRISGSLKLVLDNVAVLALLTGSASSLSLKWSSTANAYHMITLPRIFIQKTGPVLANDGPVVIDAQFRAVYNTGDSTSLIMVTGSTAEASAIV